MPARKKNGKRRSPNVPGQALGYSLQVTRLTHLLVDAVEGSYGSLEVIDDVGLVDADGTTTAVQSKSALTGNPLSDHSAALWKTLANWADSLATDILACDKLHLVLYVSKPASGSIAELLSNAKTDGEVKDVITKVQTELRSKGPASDSEAKKHIDRFFAHELNVLETVIKAFQIECGSGTGVSREFPAAFEREFQRVQEAVQMTTEKLRAVEIRRKALSGRSREAEQRQFEAKRVERFIGRLESDLKTYERLGTGTPIR